MPDIFDDYSTRLQLEKLVIGLEEPILIKGAGEFIAKVDSGNGGFNVLHGENIIQQGDVITFKTYNADNEPKMISKKLKQFVNVNIGSGNIEERPVIELDVQFAGDLYKKIPFSIANRNSNSHRVLICKDFVKDELEALIDPAEQNLTVGDKKVEYVKEAVNVVRKDRDSDLTFGQKILAGTKTAAKRTVRGLQSFGNLEGTHLIGTDVDITATAKDEKEQQAQAKQDEDVIRKKIGRDEELEKYGITNGRISLNDIVCCKLVDYLGFYWNSGKNVVKSEQQRYNQYNQLIKSKDNNSKNDQLQQNQTQPQQQQVQNNINSAQTDNTNAIQQNNIQQTNAKQAESLKDILKIYQLRNKFFLYFVFIGKDIKPKYTKFEKLLTKALKNTNLPDLADKMMMNLGNDQVLANNKAINRFLTVIERAINKAKLNGMFIFCSTQNNQRITEIIKPHTRTEDTIEDNIKSEIDKQEPTNTQTEEDEEVIYDSFIPCLNRYYNRLGYNIFLDKK